MNLTIMCIAAIFAAAELPVAPPADAEVALRVSFSADRVEVIESDGRTTLISPPCAVSLAVVQGQRILVGCAGGGVHIVERGVEQAYELTGSFATDGAVRGFHTIDGQVWVQLHRVEARPIESLARGPGGVPSTTGVLQPVSTVVPPVESSQVAERVGRVVEEQAHGVVIDLGGAAGLAPGDRVELFVRQEVSLPGGETAVEENRVAVGRVRTASEGYSRVTLGLNEQVAVGTLARPTTAKTTGSRWLPRRPGGLLSGAVTLRPFLALGDFGFGTVSDLVVAYRFFEPFRVQLVLEPLGLGLADAGNIVATAGNFFASYDEDVFEVGLGAGWSAVNNDLGSPYSDYDRAASEGGFNDITAEFNNVQYGFSLGQIARLGPEDGVHLLVRNTFVLYENEFHYGGTVGQAMFPVGERSAVFGRGGGGQAGFAYGELGLRLLLFGNGLHDSLFVSASLGGAGLFGETKVPMGRCLTYEGDVYLADDKCFESLDYAGPMVGLGFEYRL